MGFLLAVNLALSAGQSAPWSGGQLPLINRLTTFLLSAFFDAESFKRSKRLHAPRSFRLPFAETPHTEHPQTDTDDAQ